MYLKSVEIQGFKSFPEKTVLNFGEDITAIVGPNGSGKSNISDAIRWVMGEQNSRQLRGAKMEDVIFGGTEKRNQMGFAQVTLVIDNTEHIFNRDEAEVAVTRRYYRSGESEYYINKQSVRLKDVNELFMDTGMGREGYSIIGQGKIDEILSVKSGERREIFEEAAGISKFRHRKEESERKLARTEENLVRINDKIAELELQVEPLRAQAETAKKYLILRDELRVLEISVWLEQLQNIKTASFKLQSDFKTAQEDKDRAQAALDAVYAAAEQCGEQVRQKDLDAEALREQLSGLESQSAELDSAIAVLKTGMEHNAESLQRLDREMADSQQRTENLQSQIDAAAQRVAEIDDRTRQLDGEVDALLQEMRTIAENAGSVERESEVLRAKQALEIAAAADTKAELSALNASVREVAERRTAVESELAAAREKLAGSEKESKENRKALNAAREEAQAVSNIISGHSLKMDGRRRRAEEAAQKKLQLTMEENNLSSKIHMYSAMEKEYEGFSKAVKTVMQSAQKNALRGIHGPVASLLTMEERYTVAVETALGGGLQNIVVDREEDAKSAMVYLKQRDGGRATFLPLTTIRGEELREKGVDDEYGFVGIASELIRYEKKYEGIFRNLLGRTVVVEDLDCGIAIARKYQNRFRIVTLDGQVINRGGSMTGGSVNRSTNILSRANELKHMRAQQEILRAQLSEAAARAGELERELQKAQYELDVAREQQRKAEDDVLMLEGKQNHYDILTENLSLSCEAMEQELENLAARTAADAQKMKAAQEKIAAHEQAAAALQAEAEAQQAGQSNLQAETDRLSAAIAEKREQKAALQAERDASVKNGEDLKALQADMLADSRSREELAESFRRDNEAARSEMAQRQSELAGLRARSESLREQLRALGEAKMALEAQRTAQNQKIQECNDELLHTEREVGRLEQKLSAGALEEKAILDKLWERYELSHSDAMEQRMELESVPKATRRIAELNREIKGLGTPNIGAINEFDRVNSRYTYLSEQRTDVEKAKEELNGIIDQITAQMTEIFAEQFKLLNESFQETFLELFGGGQARLELEDENDILGCGIEIKVQPPGKQLKTITLLSGGEKAFVAIALYFAILKVHPTPFCVMDEIEAALDEANVVRYARYMRRIAGKTQFIVITHRRGTMEEADVLYGVTMQERGVSRILTINLNDMAKELKIKN
ncbi:MAG: chromosome segregation protein SMC [Ruminococcaceae bacterium]|nr:chromosome segregation protein SMC [Oscillospiraceae bacterium]